MVKGYTVYKWKGEYKNEGRERGMEGGKERERERGKGKRRVVEQIEKTQAEPQWIVAQRLLSALTIPGFT